MTTHPLIILNADDASRLSHIHAESFGRAWAADQFEGLLELSTTLGLATGDRGVGFQAFILVSVVAPEAEILTIATAPNYRRQGLAQSLLAGALFHLGERAVERVFLEVSVSNQPARRFYEQSGFVQTGKRPNYYTYHDGTREDALIMARSLGGL